MNERISALMDGEVEESELTGELVRLRTNADLRRTWDTYHLIGDTLRGHGAPALAARVSERLANEPTVLAPQRRRARRGRIIQFGFSAAAGLAGIALVAWLALPGLNTDSQQVAASATTGVPRAASVPAAPPVAVGVDDYLLAHQSFSPKGAMQGVAPYVRTVADEREGAENEAGPPPADCRAAAACFGGICTKRSGGVQWLQRIYSATQKLSYTGMFVYQHDDQVETSRITR